VRLLTGHEHIHRRSRAGEGCHVSRAVPLVQVPPRASTYSHLPDYLFLIQLSCTCYSVNKFIQIITCVPPKQQSCLPKWLPSCHPRGDLSHKVNNMSSAVTADTADTADTTTRHSPDPSDVMSRVQVLIVVVTEIEPEALGMLLLTMVSPEQTPILPSLQD
jgi:hypothetical protein